MLRRAIEDPDREDRILFEIVVDAYNETERAMSWYCYLQDQLKFPFFAICHSVVGTSKLELNQRVKVLSLAPEDNCMSGIFVLVRVGKSNVCAPLAQLKPDCQEHDTCQAVADWHYWKDRGYEY